MSRAERKGDRRYLCFLRAINVGGHNVTMAELRNVFVSLRFRNVETFIASGNVIIEAPSDDIDALRARIEKALRKSLGYDVDAFLRTEMEIWAAADALPFTPAAIEGARALNIAFASRPVTDEEVAVFNTDTDEFKARGREIYWLCTARQSESKFVSAQMERRLGIRVTWRGINTVRRLSEKYPPQPRARQ